GGSVAGGGGSPGRGSAFVSRPLCSAIGRGGFGVCCPSRRSTFSHTATGPGPDSASAAPARQAPRVAKRYVRCWGLGEPGGRRCRASGDEPLPGLKQRTALAPRRAGGCRPGGIVLPFDLPT